MPLILHECVCVFVCVCVSCKGQSFFLLPIHTTLPTLVCIYLITTSGSRIHYFLTRQSAWLTVDPILKLGWLFSPTCSSTCLISSYNTVNTIAIPLIEQRFH
ncbi:hypothetical protein F4774DRAFT_259718 [Daldinia eschscholtzii]|nr:hypothetical protein F4774DRAFT_259718 [Daldinia eschscholtzii]